MSPYNTCQPDESDYPALGPTRCSGVSDLEHPSPAWLEDDPGMAAAVMSAKNSVPWIAEQFSAAYPEDEIGSAAAIMRAQDSAAWIAERPGPLVSDRAILAIIDDDELVTAAKNYSASWIFEAPRDDLVAAATNRAFDWNAWSEAGSAAMFNDDQLVSAANYSRSVVELPDATPWRVSNAEAFECYWAVWEAKCASDSARSAVKALKEFAAEKAAGKETQSLGAWFETAIDDYSLDSKDHFRTFFYELHTQSRGSLPLEIDHTYPSLSLRVKLDGGVLANLSYSHCGDLGQKLFVDGYLRTLLVELAQELKSEEPSPEQILRHLCHRLTDKLKEVAARLTCRRPRLPEIRNTRSTRDQVLSFALWTGNPPPSGIRFPSLARMDSRIRDARTRRKQSEALRRRGSRRDLPDRFRAGVSSARRPWSTKANATAERRSWPAGRCGIQSDSEMAEGFGALRSPGRWKMVRHLRMGGRPNWRH